MYVPSNGVFVIALVTWHAVRLIGHAGGQAGRWAGGQADRRTGGQVGRRSGEQARRRAGEQARRRAGEQAGKQSICAKRAWDRGRRQLWATDLDRSQ